MEIQGPSRRGGSSAVTGALLGRSCWQCGPQRRRLPSAIPAASAVWAAKQTDPGQRSQHTLVLHLPGQQWAPQIGAPRVSLGTHLPSARLPAVAECRRAVADGPCTRDRRQPGLRGAGRWDFHPLSPGARALLDLCPWSGQTCARSAWPFRSWSLRGARPGCRPSPQVGPGRRRLTVVLTRDACGGVRLRREASSRARGGLGSLLCPFEAV